MLADTVTASPIPEWLTALLSGNLTTGAAILIVWWKWVQPLLKRITVRHFSFLDSMEKSQERMLEIMLSWPQLSQSLAMKIDAVHSDVKKLRPRPDSDSIPITQPPR